MELTTYLHLIRRWLWLIILAVVVGGSLGFAVTRTEPPQYQASTTIQIGSYSIVANPDLGMISTSTQLTQTYAALVKTRPILEAVIKKLQLSMTTNELVALFNVRLVSETSLMTIAVTFTDPVVASDIANELATQLIAYSPTDTSKDQKDQIALLQSEIDDAKKQLENSRSELATLSASTPSSDAQEQAKLTARRTELLSEINAEQTNLASMSATLATLQGQGNVNTVRVVDPAPIPTVSVNPSPIMTALLAAAVGAILAVGIALLIEYFNNSIRSPSEIMTLLGVTLLGSISSYGRKGTYKNKLITWSQPRSSVSEAFRGIRVNLLIRDSEEEIEQPFNSYVITSPGPGEGKSITAANLAVTFAITGMRVLVVDTDLRRPTIHHIFNLPNHIGLSNAWGNSEAEREKALTMPVHGSNGRVSEIEQAVKRVLDLQFSALVQQTEIPRLDVITAGPAVSNPAELLNTPHVRTLIQHVTERASYDVVIFDTPPALVVSDSTIVANATKAEVIMVVESGRTRRPSAARAIEQIRSLSIPIVGVIMNRLKSQDRDADYGYYYYYGYNRDEEKVRKAETANQPK